MSVLPVLKPKSVRFVGVVAFGILIFGATTFSQEDIAAPKTSDDYSVSIFFQGSDPKTAQNPQLVKKWKLTDLKSMPQITAHERNPLTGNVAKYVGVYLAKVIDEAFKEIPPEKRAQVDLIVLKNDQGKQALIPLFFSNRYPVLLALHKDRMGLGPLGPVYSVVPWTSKPKVLKESVPLESFFITRINEIQLTNYHQRYGSFFLKRMTDPAAVRGQKLFVQSCVSCHAGGQGPALDVVANVSEEQQKKLLEAGSHPAKAGVRLSQHDLRALMSYLRAYQQEKLVSKNSS